jgi:hypothetical protein
MSPRDLRKVAKKVVWFKAPDDALRDLQLFLAHVVTYGTLSAERQSLIANLCTPIVPSAW